MLTEAGYVTLYKEAVQPAKGVYSKARETLRHITLDIASKVIGGSKKGGLRCLYCHYVFDDQVEKFDALISELKKTGEFITTSECLKVLRGGGKIDGNYYHLSFDDGFRNNYTNAVPILLKHKVPAIFFVPSALIECDWEKAKKYCLETTCYSSVIEMLRWNDLREMISLGHEIGSHTRTHAKFSEISKCEKTMHNEISQSKDELERELERECKYISWPYGTLSDADDASIDMARKAGYDACFGAFRDVIQAGKTDLFKIPRHHFEVQWPFNHVRYFLQRYRMSG